MLSGRPASSATRTKHRATDDDPPVRKAARAVTYTTQDESSSAGTSAAVFVAQYNVAPAMGPVPSDRRRQCSCRYHVSFLRKLLRITSIRPRSRPRCTHRLPGVPGAMSSWGGVRRWSRTCCLCNCHESYC